MSPDPPLAVLSPLLSCQQIHSCSPASTFVVSADPPLAVLSPLLSCQQIHSRSPASTFVVSADPPLAVLSPLSLCQQIHFSCLHFCRVSRSTSRVSRSTSCVRRSTSRVSRSTSRVSRFTSRVSRSTSRASRSTSRFSRFTSRVSRSTSRVSRSTSRVSRSTSRSPVSTFVVSADPPLSVLSPLLSCQQIHLSQSCLHFFCVSRSTSLSPVSTFVMSADPPLMSADPPLVSADPLLSPLLSCHLLCQQIHLSQSCLHFCCVSRSISRSPVSIFCHSSRSSYLSQYFLHLGQVRKSTSRRLSTLADSFFTVLVFTSHHVYNTIIVSTL